MIHVNDRICQFRIMEHQPALDFEETDVLGNEDRGGHGSTGKNKGTAGGEEMRIRLHLAALLLGVSLAAGCRGTDPAREQFRLDGIAQMEQGDYEGAIASFDEAIAHSDGRVGDFELDVLKYGGEAECKLGDYPAAAHTYDVLL